MKKPPLNLEEERTFAPSSAQDHIIAKLIVIGSFAGIRPKPESLANTTETTMTSSNTLMEALTESGKSSQPGKHTRNPARGGTA